MSKQNPFAIAEGKRIEITNEQAKQIRDMYKGIEKEFGERIRILSNKTNISSIMREQYLKDFTKDLQDRITILNYQLENTITNNALEVAKAVTEDNEKMLREMGFGGVFTSNYYIPQDAVNSIITGKLYEGKWTLSKAIWSDNQKKLNDINSIVAKGMAENKSTYELAKDLERYVNPAARKEWSWSKVYPGTSKKIDYNAQRLARTMVSHAYQESFVLNTKDNPFIEAYQWLASGGDRMCDICAERDGKIYQKDELPLDHPNGMCTFTIVREKSYEQIARDLKAWVDGTGDSELNAKLDEYANTLGYNVKEWTANTPQVKKIDYTPLYHGTSYENIISILEANELRGNIANETEVYGVSTTRNKYTAYSDIRIVLSKEALMTRYKVHPVYRESVFGRDLAEERLDKTVTNLSKYIKDIQWNDNSKRNTKLEILRNKLVKNFDNKEYTNTPGTTAYYLKTLEKIMKEKGYEVTDPKLQEAFDYIHKFDDRIFDEEKYKRLMEREKRKH